jgi:hypothetical protein
MVLNSENPLTPAFIVIIGLTEEPPLGVAAGLPESSKEQFIDPGNQTFILIR